MTQQTADKHPLKPVSSYTSFPLDEYIDVGCIAYHIADLPPSPKFADNNDTVPSVRFLFSDGSTRKWTKWCPIKYSSKSSLSTLFHGIPGLANLLTVDNNLFSFSFKILLESKNNEFSNIIKVKVGTKSVDNIFYDAEFIPYKYVKAYGNLVNLRLATLKTKDGIKTLSPDEMIDPPSTQQ